MASKIRFITALLSAIFVLAWKALTAKEYSQLSETEKNELAKSIVAAKSGRMIHCASEKKNSPTSA